MDYDDVVKLVKNNLGNDEYKKGSEYDEDYIRYPRKYRLDINEYQYVFNVESERTWRYYDVIITTKNNTLNSMYCSCPQHFQYHKCKHIAACLLHYQDFIFPKPKDPYEVTADFLKSFKPSIIKSSNIKQQLK